MLLCSNFTYVVCFICLHFFHCPVFLPVVRSVRGSILARVIDSLIIDSGTSHRTKGVASETYSSSENGGEPKFARVFVLTAVHSSRVVGHNGQHHRVQAHHPNQL